jgi:hypothetical protein
MRAVIGGANPVSSSTEPWPNNSTKGRLSLRLMEYSADLWIYQQAQRPCFRSIREKLPTP